MKLEKPIAEIGLSALLHGIYLLILTVLGISAAFFHEPLAYLIIVFAVIALIAMLYSFGEHRKRKQGDHLRRQIEGYVYPEGERQAIPDIKRDINSLQRGDTVSYCGSGATSIIYLATEIYEALKRGVDFEVYVIHPHETIVNLLAEMEEDLIPVVVKPMIEQLGEEELRKLLGPEWCDKTAEILNKTDTVCSLHESGHNDCSMQGRVICTATSIWRQVAAQVINLNRRLGEHHGTLSVRGYHMIPSVKAWRFNSRAGETNRTWYYVADHFYHSGVAVDNPMRRFEVGKEGPSFVNKKFIDAYFDRASTRYQELFGESLVEITHKTGKAT